MVAWMADADELSRTTKIALFEKRPEEAEKLARDGLCVDPESWDLKYCLGRALMLQGRWSEGWPLMEFREVRRIPRGPTKLPYPEWRGEPLDGLSILVWGEQGIGDEIMFARFIPMLRTLNPSRITVACLALNQRVFTQLGADALIGRVGEKVSVPRHDRWVLVGSLPFLLGVTRIRLEGGPYLRASAVGAPGIGLVERGHPRHANDRFRSLPHGSLVRAVPRGRLLQPTGDVLDSLQQVAALDLLISVDTSWAHMAGALGVPCWLLLSKLGLDWRWGSSGVTTPWYASLRLFRQQTPQRWDDVLEAVAAKLV
jgi:hypothetical protein